MKVFIYKCDGLVFRYLVYADQEWPYGRVVTVCMTQRGARWAARRELKKRIPERVLVETVS